MAAVEHFLRLRRTTGFDLSTAESLLASFARFAAERNEMLIRTQTAIDWAAQGPSAAQRDARLKAVCRFARHACAEDDRHDLPPANFFAWRKKRRPPYIYTKEEVDLLIEAATQLCPRGALRPYTYATLLALLASTGLRISEALGLRFADITADGLLIRETKFRKTRLVPLHDSGTAGLERYLTRRRNASPNSAALGQVRTSADECLCAGLAHRKGLKLGSIDSERMLLHSRTARVAGIAMQCCRLGGYTHLETTARYAQVATGLIAGTASPFDQEVRTLYTPFGMR